MKMRRPGRRPRGGTRVVAEPAPIGGRAGRRGRGGALSARLLAANLLVMAAGGVTVTVVLLLVGPPLFTRHVHEALGVTSPEVHRHLDEAFSDALAISLGIATAAAALAAFAVSVLVSRRISVPVAKLAAATRRIAAGAYEVRLPPARLGREFDELHDAFESMTASLARTEAVRRRILADLAHELRTPLATVDAYLEGMADGVVPVGEETFDVLRDQTARLGRLAEDVATVSQAEEHRLELRLMAADPAVLVARAAAAAGPAYADKAVELTVRVTDDELPAVCVDAERMAQVLGNLLDNALRHTPAGGTVTEIATAGAGGVGLSVADTGDGIAPDALNQVFERFYRADQARDRAHGGSGIGLTIATAIVDAHGGTTPADSPGPGRGATFTVTLPAAGGDCPG